MDPLVQNLVEEAERAARFIRGQTPATLRAWAARKEDFRANGVTGTCLPADALERAATQVRDGHVAALRALQAARTHGKRPAHPSIGRRRWDKRPAD
jgi:hypothetical protein